MLRIDPGSPPLWRSSSTLQFGMSDVARVHDPLAWQLRLIRVLEVGIADDALEGVAAVAGAPHGGAAALVEAIRPALMTSQARARLPLIVRATAEVSYEQSRLVVDTLHHEGFEVSVASLDSEIGAVSATRAVSVVVAAHILEPRVAARLMSHDLSHIPVVLGGCGVEIGPLVRPGETACTTCVALHRKDADPAWPMLAAQLTSRRVDNVDPGVLREAAVLAARLASGTAPADPTATIISIRADSVLRDVQHYPPHAECRCRSLAGIETAGDPVSLAPSSGTVFARLA